MLETTNPKEENKIKFENSIKKEINHQKENLRNSPRIESIKKADIFYRVLSKGKDPSPDFKSYMFSEDLLSKNIKNFYYTYKSDYDVANNDRRILRKNNHIDNKKNIKRFDYSSRSFIEDKSKSSMTKNEHIKVDWNNYTSKFQSPHKSGDDIIVKKYHNLGSGRNKIIEQNLQKFNSFGNSSFQSYSTFIKRNKKDSKIHLEFENIDKDVFIKLKTFFFNLEPNYNNEILKNEKIFSELLFNEYQIIRNYFHIYDRDNFCKLLEEATSANQGTFTFIELIRFLFDYKISNPKSKIDNELNNSQISFIDFKEDKIFKIIEKLKGQKEKRSLRSNLFTNSEDKNKQQENLKQVKNRNKSFQEKSEVLAKVISNPFILHFRRENKSMGNIQISERTNKQQRRLGEAKEDKFKFHAREVPLECKILKFDEIMRAEEERRKIVKENSAKMTLENQRPFTFYSRDNEFLKRKKDRIIKAQEKIFGDKFKAKPSPKTSKISYKVFIERENTIRNERIEANKIKLLQNCSLPENMQKNQHNQEEKKQKLMDSLSIERARQFTFSPQICSKIPDFERLQKEFERELEQKRYRSSNKSHILTKSNHIEKNSSETTKNLIDNKMKERYISNRIDTSSEQSKRSGRLKSVMTKGKTQIFQKNNQKIIQTAKVILKKKGYLQNKTQNGRLPSPNNIKNSYETKEKVELI